jgi:hypothetical protein
MVFVVDPIKFLMLFVKLTNAIISLIIAIKIKRLSKYVLNYLFFLAFTGWSVFIAADGILYVIAPNGEFLFYLANLLRDLGIIMIGLIPLCFVQAGWTIKEGQEIALNKKRKRLIASFIFNFSIIIGAFLFDSINVYNISTLGDKTIIPPSNLPPTGSFVVGFDSSSLQGIIGILFYLSFVVWYFYGVNLMFSVQKRESGICQKRTRRMMSGIVLIPIGILYFTFLPFLGLPQLVKPYFLILGQVIWALSPILVYLGLSLQPKEKEMQISNIS